MADKCESIIGEAMAEVKAAVVNRCDWMKESFARLESKLLEMVGQRESARSVTLSIDAFAPLQAQLASLFESQINQTNATVLDILKGIDLTVPGAVEGLPELIARVQHILAGGEPNGAGDSRSSVAIGHERVLKTLASRSNFRYVQVPFGPEMGTHVKVEFPSSESGLEFYLALMALNNATA